MGIFKGDICWLLAARPAQWTNHKISVYICRAARGFQLLQKSNPTSSTLSQKSKFALLSWRDYFKMWKLLLSPPKAKSPRGANIIIVFSLCRTLFSHHIPSWTRASVVSTGSTCSFAVSGMQVSNIHIHSRLFPPLSTQTAIREYF